MKLLIVVGGGFRVPQVIEVLAAARAGSGTHGRVLDEFVALEQGVLGQETVGTGG
ncbi:hypothetical protein [Actinomyces sp.]|uniref:hypothetical protein n=1 Tax=Actinomyces sp. TaxID=29317 RepID=UPI0026DD21A9|nr:hypothetical protein [Actinomyces sp.]MDO4900175.1 hypothetical protein [Actinomyces sp.]